MILSPTEAVISMIMNAISRKFEWEADAFACELNEKLPNQVGVETMGDRLAQALIGIHVKNLSTVWVDWLYANHFFRRWAFFANVFTTQILRGSSLAPNVDRKVEGSRWIKSWKE